jgi:hypothetical protein
MKQEGATLAQSDSEDFMTVPSPSQEFDLGPKPETTEKTFEKTFNKELDLSLSEVPTVLFELHENSLLYMDREEWE